MSEITNITIDFSDYIENVSLNVLQPVDNISIDKQTGVDNITLNLSSAIVTGAAVTSVNSLRDSVILTASTTLSLTSSSSGYFDHIFTHNLDYQNVFISVIDQNNRVVYADIFNEDPNYVNIRAAIDLTGYKAVAQR